MLIISLVLLPFGIASFILTILSIAERPDGGSDGHTFLLIFSILTIAASGLFLLENFEDQVTPSKSEMIDYKHPYCEVD